MKLWPCLLGRKDTLRHFLGRKDALRHPGLGRRSGHWPGRSRSGRSSFRGAARALSLTAATALAVSLMTAPAWAAAGGAKARAASRLTVVYQDLALLNGDTATVYSNGLAEVWNPSHSQVEYRNIPPTAGGEAGTAAALPGRAQILFDLLKAPAQPYLPGQLEVVLSPDVRATEASRVVPAAALRSGSVPAYTGSAAFNRVLARLGVDRLSAVFGGSALRGLRPEPGQLDLAQAYVMHLTAATMPAALSALSASGGVAYAAPDWTVATMATNPIPVPAASVRAADAVARELARHPARRYGSSGRPALPSNYALQSSEQSLLNRPGVDWTPAYEALEAKYHQLPGAGEIITDVSLGDLDSTGLRHSDPCYGYVNAFGPTTIVRGGQRYLDWPSMPLIPTYTTPITAPTLDPAGEVCGVDPFDEEIGLDFAMMAPLPHNLQRAGGLGSGLTDLLGIAPGAKFRLVVTSDTTGAITSIDESFLAAAQQTPRPNVITASLGFGEDAYGFPSRYLEDDPLTESLIYSIVHQYGINVSISSNDGLRTETNAAVSPSGGSAATNVVASGGSPTNLNSIFLSTTPSADYDSGSIDAGGTTLDDISAAPPDDPTFGSLASQHAFAETRWDGYGSFSSGYGSRVDVSAPADNLTAFEHTFAGAATDVTVDNIGGTSGSAQEIGAAAAVVQQAARLAGNTQVAGDPLALRAWLEKTGTAVPAVPQADTALNVGRQLDLGDAVTSLVGSVLAPGVARVAVEQRQPYPGYIDAVFSTATDPGDISLAGVDQDAYVTISPDWVGLPAGATYRLTAVRETGGQRLLGTGAWARLLPDAIFAAAGVPPPVTQSQAVTLSYTASSGGKVVARATIPLSFSPVSGGPEVLAPVVPAVVTGSTIPVEYNLGSDSGFTQPQLVVSTPGRMNPLDDHFFRDLYTVPLTSTSGTVDVPVSALTGGGIYGIAIQATPTTFEFSDFAYTRVQDAGSDVRPAAPVLSVAGSAPGYLQSVPYDGTFGVSWNVTGVPGATGAYLEISAPGPNDFNSFATFNNPNGTIRDDNGYDSGSVYYQALPAASGSITVSAAAAGLVPTMYSNVRVLPVNSAGTAAGEASDVSTISMDGVTPTDGGATVEGFGVDQNSTTGFVTSNQTNADNETQSSVETFDEQTQAITRTVISSTEYETYTTLDAGGPGVFAADTGLIEASTDTTTGYNVLQPLGKLSRVWKPPVTSEFIQPADNQATPSDAFGSWTYGNKHGDHDYKVFSSDVAAGTFGRVFSAEAPLKSFGLAVTTGFAEDTATGTAVINAVDFFNLSAAPTFVTVNLATGAVTSFAGVGSGIPTGLAIDSGTGIAANPEPDGVALINLATDSGTLTTPGGFVYQHPAVDAAQQEFVVQEVSPPDANTETAGLGAVPNNNALSAEIVVNEQGQVQDRIEQFNFYNVFTSIAGQLTQLGPVAGEAYTTGLLGGEVQPFSY
jgi:hypothetical protein